MWKEKMKSLYTNDRRSLKMADAHQMARQNRKFKVEVYLNARGLL